MRVRVGVTEGPEFELEADDDFKDVIERAFADGAALVWSTDRKGNNVGLPVARITYIVLEDSDDRLEVGFA